MQERKPRGKQSPVKAKTVTRETFELSHHTFCSQSEEEDKAKIPEHLPNTLDQATKQSHY